MGGINFQIKNWVIAGTGLLLLVFFGACDNQSRNVKGEDWVNLPKGKWPQMVMTSEVEFDDTTFTDFANGFLVNTGNDTVAVTVKHAFAAFSTIGLMTVDFQNRLKRWEMYPKNDKSEKISLSKHPHQKVHSGLIDSLMQSLGADVKRRKDSFSDATKLYQGCICLLN